MRTLEPYLLRAKDVWWPNRRDPSVLVVPFVALLLTLVFTSKWFRDIIMLLNTPIRNASTGLTYCGENSTENGEEFEPVTHCSCSPPF